ncbi:MAG: citrate synthase [Flavobacteriales bacterium]|nr:citrate synthase [Flavobacteriales bacterium]
MSEFAQLTFDENTIQLPVVRGSEKEIAVDISKLRGQSGLITLDRGFKNTGATHSAITFLDGEKGILRYRGYAIEELAEKASFAEVSYLLIYGELPTVDRLSWYNNSIVHHTLVHENMKSFFSAFPLGAHPMGMLSAMVSTLSTFYPGSQSSNRSMEDIELTIHRLIAKLPTLASQAYKHNVGLPTVYPQNELSYTENFLYMMFGLPTEEFEINPVVDSALNKLLILHADHEQNCSTATVRVVGSSQANLYSSISAGISALWGPLHGGANQAVIEMLEQIKLDGGDLQKWIEKAKDKSDSFRLMGFGHRVYKNFDPRARIIKKAADDVLEALGVDDPILDIAKELEQVALKDEYFVERGLYPNVDFYSGIIYRALGIPTEMFTVMFALGRLPGWIAQWKEMTENNDPIGRPRQVYTGPTERPFVEIDGR